MQTECVFCIYALSCNSWYLADIHLICKPCTGRHWDNRTYGTSYLWSVFWSVPLMWSQLSAWEWRLLSRVFFDISKTGICPEHSVLPVFFTLELQYVTIPNCCFEKGMVVVVVQSHISELVAQKDKSISWLIISSCCYISKFCLLVLNNKYTKFIVTLVRKTVEICKLSAI